MGRDEIVTEMRRTAAANGGKPLGAVRFQRETGIGVHSWIKYWPRFGDLQREAGFQPNGRPAPYEHGYLYEKLVELIREIGRYPSYRELLHRSYAVEDFPSPTAFRRLGDQARIILGLLGYCAAKPEHADVRELLSEVPSQPAVASSGGTQSAASDGYGFVYMVEGHEGEYKIGHTNLVDRRVTQLGVKAAVAPTLVHEIKTDDPRGVEAYWHRRFKPKRMRGEWFKLDPQDVRAFKRWRRIYS